MTGLRLTSTVDGSTREIAVDGVFVAIGHLPRTGFLRGQVALDEAGYINGTVLPVDGGLVMGH